MNIAAQPSRSNQAEAEISAAWRNYQQTEKYGIEFGRVCCEWRDKLKAQGKKGHGLIPMLEQVGIPTSTAYWWMDRYEVATGTCLLNMPKAMATEGINLVGLL